MIFAQRVLFVDGVGYSLAARSRDDMFIKKHTFCIILWYLLLITIFRLFEQDMLGADLFFADFGLGGAFASDFEVFGGAGTPGSAGAINMTGTVDRKGSTHGERTPGGRA